MSYDLIEVSRDDAQPVELYIFNYGVTSYRYNTSALLIEHAGENFLPVAVRRDAVESGSDVGKTRIKIRLPANVELSNIFRISPPTEPVTVTVLGIQQDDPDGGFVTVWKGKVATPDWKPDGFIEFVCESAAASLRRTGLRRTCQPQCTFVLYDPETCGVDKEDFKREGAPTSITGLTIVEPMAAGAIKNWYAGGYITWVHNVYGNTERRGIRESFSDGKLILSSLPTGLAVGQDTEFFAGCSHVLSDPNGCIDKFDNHRRYGGEPFQPTKRPFNTTMY